MEITWSWKVLNWKVRYKIGKNEVRKFSINLERIKVGKVNRYLKDNVGGNLMRNLHLVFFSPSSLTHDRPLYVQNYFRHNMDHKLL